MTAILLCFFKSYYKNRHFYIRVLINLFIYKFPTFYAHLMSLLGRTSRRSLAISQFTQQDGRKRRTAKRLCVTNVTGLLLACSVVIFTKYQCFLVFYKKICLKEVEVCVKFFSSKIIVTLVTQGLPSSSSPVLMRKFTFFVISL